MKKPSKKTVVRWSIVAAAAAVIGLWFILAGGTESYRAKYANADLTTGVEGIRRENTYASYRTAHENGAAEDIAVDVAAFAPADGVEYRADMNAVYTAFGSKAQWTVNVPQAGYYRIGLRYFTVESRGVDIERAVYINGEIPFEGAEAVAFTRLWTDGSEVRTDNQGNQIRPIQTEVYDWQTAFCKDPMGYTTQPYEFYFHQGDNTLMLEAKSEPMLIGGITLTAAAPALSYEAYLKACPTLEKDGGAGDYQLIIEGEDAERRSSPSLYARYDRSSAATVPYDIRHTVLNYIGGEAWRNPGQWIQWHFTVPEDGYYTITVKGRQTYARGNIASRAVYIDGKVPFTQAQNLSFGYRNEWVLNTLQTADGEPCRVYLAAGEHTIRLESTLGDMGAILSAMEDSIYRLNRMYRKLLVLTGPTPDQFRDYHLAQTYPEVIEAMALESKLLYKLVDDAVAVTGQKSDRIAVAQTLARQLEIFADNPDKITPSFIDFKNNITSLGTSMQALSETKLDIDQIIISGAKAKVTKPTENVFTKLIHEASACIASYTIDYNALGDVYDGGNAEDVIEVWILTGRDQSTILKTMVDDTFTPASGIRVNVKLVDPNALLSAVVAGNGPDVVVSTDTWNPVNYALRNATENLRQFADAEEVLKDFYPSAYAALEFEGGLYALPETQICNVLIYRSDILEEYGWSVPETWQDLIALLPSIQGNNMAMAIPYPDIVAPNLASYYAMIYQNGGGIYNDSGSKTLVANEAGIAAFETYTSLFTDYGLPTVFDFVSRFRSGEMPMGIFDYTVFNTLTVSAPEIRGLWDIAVIPGTARTDENGNAYIDHTGHSQGACCMMIATKDETVKQNAWEFMKWWVSEEAQVRFGREIESILGSSARYATANLKAMEQMPWSDRQIAVIKAQMQWARGFREVAGGYYTNRHLTNAVRKIVNEKTDRRETLLNYARTINEEIVKKREEFGLPTDD